MVTDSAVQACYVHLMCLSESSDILQLFFPFLWTLPQRQDAVHISTQMLDRTGPKIEATGEI